ncbi:RepB family protein [Escherichia coli]
MSQTENAVTSSSGKNDLTEGVILFLRENDKSVSCKKECHS